MRVSISKLVEVKGFWMPNTASGAYSSLEITDECGSRIFALVDAGEIKMIRAALDECERQRQIPRDPEAGEKFSDLAKKCEVSP